VKSSTEIINILNSELKTARSTEDTKTLLKPAVTGKSPVLPCGNCAQLVVKLHKAQEESNSQKLIISLLNEDNKPANQLQQPNIEVNNGLHTDEVLSCPPRPKKTHTSQDTLNYKQYEQYATPTSNRYAELYSLPDHQDFSSQIFPKEQEI
jgi:hypothetical protein